MKALFFSILLFASHQAYSESLFECTGNGVQVAYSSTSFAGVPLITYTEGKKAWNFTGPSLQNEKTLVGSWISSEDKKIGLKISFLKPEKTKPVLKKEKETTKPSVELIESMLVVERPSNKKFYSLKCKIENVHF